MKTVSAVVSLAAAALFVLSAASNDAFAGGKGRSGNGQMLRDGSHVGTAMQGNKSSGGNLNTKGRLGDGTMPKPQDGTGFGYGDGTKPRPQDGTGFGAGK
jgi:hypothetical protein